MQDRPLWETPRQCWLRPITKLTSRIRHVPDVRVCALPLQNSSLPLLRILSTLTCLLQLSSTTPTCFERSRASPGPSWHAPRPYQHSPNPPPPHRFPCLPLILPTSEKGEDAGRRETSQLTIKACLYPRDLGEDAYRRRKRSQR